MRPPPHRGARRQARHAAEAGVHEHQCRAHELLNLRGGDAAAAYALAQFPAFRASFDSCEPVLPLWHCAARGGQVCSATERQQRGCKAFSLARSDTAETHSAFKGLRHTTYERHCASAIAATRLPWGEQISCRETAGRAGGDARQRNADPAPQR